MKLTKGWVDLLGSRYIYVVLQVFTTALFVVPSEQLHRGEAPRQFTQRTRPPCL